MCEFESLSDPPNKTRQRRSKQKKMQQNKSNHNHTVSRHDKVLVRISGEARAMYFRKGLLDSLDNPKLKIKISPRSTPRPLPTV